VRGFTLVEAMIVLTIVGILAAYAVPSMRDMMQASRLRSASSDFYGALIQARSEAIKRHSNVTITPSASGWAGGWTVAAGATTLATHDPLESGVAVQVNVPAGTASAIVYGMNGRVSAGTQNVIFYASPAVAQPRCMSIDPSGMPRSRTDTNMTATDGCN
jgi:type IV fimbrial biogenesis protein FimT